MPIKLITSDAKGFLNNFVGDSAYADKIWNLFVSRSSKSQDSAMRLAARKGMVKDLLARASLWGEAVKSPQMVKTSKVGSNGEWNGEKLGNTKIRGKLILYRNALFDVTGFFSEEEARLIILKRTQKERSEMDFLTSRSDDSLSKDGIKRGHIPQRIRNEVWRRDGGKCVECDSVFNLEFDHVIPIAKGGSNTARNIRILCEPCNRRKSDNIG